MILRVSILQFKFCAQSVFSSSVGSKVIWLKRKKQQSVKFFSAIIISIQRVSFQICMKTVNNTMLAENQEFYLQLKLNQFMLVIEINYCFS